MEKKNRRTLFYFLGALFAITVPLILFYALGYTVDWTRRAVGKTGGIFVSAQTPRVFVSLNGVYQHTTSLVAGSALLTDIAPGTYILRIEKNGFSPWSRAVMVEPEFVTELRNILLVPNPVPIATATPAEIAALKTATSTPERAALTAKKELVRTSDGALLLTHVSFFKTVADTVFAVTDKGFLTAIKPDTKEMTIIGNPGFFMTKTPFQFVASPAGDLAIIDSGGGIYLVRDRELKTLEGGARSVVFDPEGKKLLVRKEKSVEVVWLKENRAQPFQKAGTREFILNANNEITDAQWFDKENTHIVLSTKEGIYLTELDGRGGRQTSELFSGKNEAFLVPENRPNSLFFKKGKIWYKIEL